MFTTFRGANHDRKGQRPNHRKNASSSRASLFSGITTSSGGSTGSGSTITQESVSRSRRAERTSASLRQNKEQPAQLTIARRQSTGSIATATLPTAIDVFAFLEHDPPSSFAAEPDADSHHAVRQIPSSTPLQEESDLDCSTRSLHSDSGISIRDSSPESSHYKLHPRAVLDPLREEGSTHPRHRSPLKSHQHHPRMRPGRDDDTNLDAGPGSPDERYFDDSPETFYRDYTRSNGLIATRSVQAAQRDPPTDLSGYDLLAARLSDSHPIEHPFRPLYRRFTRLNHRILLQLQDEVSQMEEDLADLDEADARVRRNSTGQVIPESRRLNWQMHGSELHARRLELLSQIYVKIEQYNQALASFQKVMKDTDSASKSDIQQYRSWMKDCAPIAEVEQRFLDDPDDLLAFCFHRSCPTCGRQSILGLDAVTGVLVVLVFVILPLIFFLFLSYPRMGPLLLIFMAVALYSNRDDVNRAVVSYLRQ